MNQVQTESFTRPITAEGGDFVLTLLVRQDADLGERFKAWDCDEQEFLAINGWMFTCEEGHA